VTEGRAHPVRTPGAVASAIVRKPFKPYASPTGNGAPKHVVAEADRVEQQFNLSVYTNYPLRLIQIARPAQRPPIGPFPIPPSARLRAR
jgi:hypothetical protein